MRNRDLNLNLFGELHSARKDGANLCGFEGCEEGIQSVQWHAAVAVTHQMGQAFIFLRQLVGSFRENRRQRFRKLFRDGRILALSELVQILAHCHQYVEMYLTAADHRARLEEFGVIVVVLVVGPISCVEQLALHPL